MLPKIAPIKESKKELEEKIKKSYRKIVLKRIALDELGKIL